MPLHVKSNSCRICHFLPTLEGFQGKRESFPRKAPDCISDSSGEMPPSSGSDLTG